MRQINRAFQTIRLSEASPELDEVNCIGTDSRNSPFGAPLTPLERQEIIDAINARESLVEVFHASPLNCGASLAVVVLDRGYVIRNYQQGFPIPPTSVFALVFSPVLLHYAWSEVPIERIFGWFWLVLFIVLIPWFTIYMRGNA
jgi:hypothetical protein